MHRLFPLFVLLACSGGTGDPTLTRPEVCDDEVDNNDNGLVDCDDTAFCGGFQCQQQDTDEDTDVPLATLEIVFSASECCDFQFSGDDCPKSVGTFSVTNRSLDLDAEIDVSCDLVGPSVPAIQWQIQGGEPPDPFIVNAPLYAETSLTIEGFFTCGVSQAFTTACRAKIENDEDSVEHEFDITGTPTGG